MFLFGGGGGGGCVVVFLFFVVVLGFGFAFGPFSGSDKLAGVFLVVFVVVLWVLIAARWNETASVCASLGAGGGGA